MKYLLTVSLLTCAFVISAKEVVVTIYKKQFTPQVVVINAGDTVIWKNTEKRQYHNVWFKQLYAKEPDYFFPGESYQKTFIKEGEFNYECGPHPKMTGKVIVKMTK